MDNLFELPSKAFHKRLLKEYNESDHPRDAKGRWTAGGAAAAGLGAAGAALFGAAALGIPGARHLLPGVRRAILGARTRGAQAAIRDPIGTVRRAEPGFGGVSETTMSAARGLFNPTGRYEQSGANAIRGLTGRYSTAARRRAAGTARAGGISRPTGVTFNPSKWTGAR